MFLSIWIWGRKSGGRRSLTSVDGAFPLFFLVLLIAMTIIFGILREAR